MEPVADAEAAECWDNDADIVIKTNDIINTTKFLTS